MGVAMARRWGVTVFLDADILIRYLTQDPPTMGKAASAFLAQSDSRHLPDMTLAETICVLQSACQVPRPQVAALARVPVSSRNIVTDDPALLVRTIDVYEHYRLSFADAYLVALAEAVQGSSIVSFDKGIGKVETIVRVEP